eukprot:6011673-Ditylum_brightwellii.AAC.1
MIGNQMNDFQMMELLDILVSLDASVVPLQNPSKVVNIFKSCGFTHDQVKMHVNLVWALTAHGGVANETPPYFKIFGMALTNMVTSRNQRKLRHLMFGKMLWSSLDP